MKKALVTFVVLAILMIIFFVTLEVTGDSAVSSNLDEGMATAESAAVFLKPDA